MQKKTVLFVDDEEKILRSLKRVFMDESFDRLYANSGQQALELLARHKVHVIVTDMRMPEMSGLDLLRIVKEKYPRIVRLVLSGYTQVTTLLTAINQGKIYKYITKPWETEDELKSAVYEAIGHYDRINQAAAQNPSA